MFSADELRIYLPKYLSADGERELFEGIKQFPNVDGAKLYTSALKDIPVIYQGDGLTDLLLFKLPEVKSQPGNGLVISNSCDTSPENKRFFDSHFCYSPILRLPLYEKSLLEKYPAVRVKNHLKELRDQLITQIFYLPQGGGLDAESFVFLDRIISMPISEIPKDICKARLFTLSNYGHYLLLVKLSVHFTRLTDPLDRGVTPSK